MKQYSIFSIKYQSQFFLFNFQIKLLEEVLCLLHSKQYFYVENKQTSINKILIYGVITTCPTNMGSGKRQSILGEFPNITENGKNQKRLKKLCLKFGLQARGIGGEHSNMDIKGTADISPSARFGVTESQVTERLYRGLINLYTIETNWNIYKETEIAKSTEINKQLGNPECQADTENQKLSCVKEDLLSETNSLDLEVK